MVIVTPVARLLLKVPSSKSTNVSSAERATWHPGVFSSPQVMPSMKSLAGISPARTDLHCKNQVKPKSLEFTLPPKRMFNMISSSSAQLGIHALRVTIANHSVSAIVQRSSGNLVILNVHNVFRIAEYPTVRQGSVLANRENDAFASDVIIVNAR